MATLNAVTCGCGSASFEFGAHDEQFTGVTVYVNTVRMQLVVWLRSARCTLTGEWFGPDAVVVGAAVCNGHMPPAILADFCDEHTPNRADSGLRAGELLRRAV